MHWQLLHGVKSVMVSMAHAWHSAMWTNCCTSVYTGVRQFMQRSIAAAHASGAVSTLMGRHRPISGLAGDFQKRSEAERKVVNSQIQVCAGAMLCCAMQQGVLVMCGRCSFDVLVLCWCSAGVVRVWTCAVRSTQTVAARQKMHAGLLFGLVVAPE